MWTNHFLDWRGWQAGLVTLGLVGSSRGQTSTVGIAKNPETAMKLPDCSEQVPPFLEQRARRMLCERHMVEFCEQKPIEVVHKIIVDSANRRQERREERPGSFMAPSGRFTVPTVDVMPNEEPAVLPVGSPSLGS